MRRRHVLTLAGTGLLAGCTGKLPHGGGSKSLTLSSPAFADGETIPREHTCAGDGVSPELHVEGIPDGAKSLALVVDDPDAPTENPYVHWLLWNVPPSTTIVPEDVQNGKRAESMGGAPQGENDAGDLGYTPPCPPEADGAHTYRFRLFAVGETLELKPGAPHDELRNALRQSTITKATLTGTFNRN